MCLKCVQLNNPFNLVGIYVKCITLIIITTQTLYNMHHYTNKSLKTKNMFKATPKYAQKTKIIIQSSSSICLHFHTILKKNQQFKNTYKFSKRQHYHNKLENLCKTYLISQKI